MSDFTLTQEMIRQFMAFIPARAILVAAKLGIADHIPSEGASAPDVARKVDADPDALDRLLRLLSSVGIMLEVGADRFALTALGETLRSDAPASVRDYAAYIHDFVYGGFSGLEEAIQSGQPSFGRVIGMPFFRFLQENPDQAAVYHAGIGNRGSLEAKAVVDAYDFSISRQVVDVGGGNGAFLSAILSKHDGVSGVLIDRTAAIEAARSGRGGPLPRCALVDADIFNGVVAGGDTYVLKRLLFDFSDEDAVRILVNCRKAIAEGGRLFIIEVLRVPSTEPSLSHSMDLLFLVMLGGRTRTEDQYAGLLNQAGFKLWRTIPTDSDVTLLEAVPS